MIRSLLVAYDGSHGARVALQHSVDLASPSQARVVLLTVGGAESDADGLAGNGVDLVALAEDAASDDSLATGNDPDQVVQEAVTVCRDLVVRGVARPAYGDVASALIAGSRLSDLVLVGRDAFESAGGADVAARTARRVAGHAESPVVVTPREYNPVRSVIAACPPSDVGARALRTAAELASILQLNVEALVFGDDRDLVGGWVRDVKRYLVDHGHAAEVQVRKPPAGPQIDSAIGARQSPLVVVPRGGMWETLRHQDLMSSALQTLGAVVVVQP